MTWASGTHTDRAQHHLLNKVSSRNVLVTLNTAGPGLHPLSGLANAERTRNVWRWQEILPCPSPGDHYKVEDRDEAWRKQVGVKNATLWLGGEHTENRWNWSRQIQNKALDIAAIVEHFWMAVVPLFVSADSYVERDCCLYSHTFSRPELTSLGRKVPRNKLS